MTYQNIHIEIFVFFQLLIAVPAKSNDSPYASGGMEVNMHGTLSESFSSNALALVPAASLATNSEANASGNSSTSPESAGAFSAPTISNQVVLSEDFL